MLIDLQAYPGWPGEITPCPDCGADSEEHAYCHECSYKLTVQFMQERNGDGYVPG